MAYRLYLFFAVALSAVAVCVGALVAPHVRQRPDGPSDFDLERRALAAELASLRASTAVVTANPADAIRLAYRWYSYAALTGRGEDFRALEAFVDGLQHELGPQREIMLLRSTLYVRVHRLDAARALLDEFPALADDPEAQLIAADVDIQQGRYDRARRAYQQVVDGHPSWAGVARLAATAVRDGDAALADHLYASAADDLTAKEMRTYAWLAVQRGQLAFVRGRYDDAEVQYRLAERAYSGYWLVDEYFGELRAAQRRFGESIARYERAIAAAPRPDLLQQLGDVYTVMGRVDAARRLHEQARDGYLTSVRQGDVQFLHHLAGYYADVARNGAEGVRWARRDAQLRPSPVTDDTLAWALYVDGQTDEAARVVERALASGIVDSHLYYHASVIKAAAGDAAAAAQLANMLHDVNPRYRDFHAHR
jgi:tetratricopeptide (TPR) repeat protein